MSSIVYHYTDTAAFKGVVDEAELWATDFRYLNDSKELNYAWDTFVAKLGQLASEPGDYAEAYSAQLRALQLMNATDLMDFDDAMFVAACPELDVHRFQWPVGVGGKWGFQPPRPLPGRRARRRGDS